MHAELPIPLIMRAYAWDPDGVRTGGAGGLESGPRRSSSRAATDPAILAPFRPGRLDPILPHKSLNQIPFLAPSITEDAALAMSPNKRRSRDRSPGFHRHLRSHCKPVKTLELCVQSCICFHTSEIAISSFPHVLQLASPRTMVPVLRITCN